MEGNKTIVLVLRSGGDFSFRDVDLIVRHINGKWMDNVRPRILCLWDRVSNEYNLGHITLLPLPKDQATPGAGFICIACNGKVPPLFIY